MEYESNNTTKSRRPSRRVAALAIATLALIGSLATAAPASAATGTVTVRGAVTCPTGQAFVGTWVNSSGGRSNFANWTRVPGTSNREAIISLTLSSVTVPTTISLNIGCGGSTSNWRYVFNNVGSVRATGSGTVFINPGCTTTRCTLAPRGTGGSTTVNPGAGSTQCTYRAAAFWKEMTGSFPGWGGNAGEWDDSNRAPRLGWSVRNWPEPNSIMVTQPSGSGLGRYGHVGYVADVRVSGGTTQVKIYDRNYDGRGGDRNGVWVSIPSGARFIQAPPRFTTHNR